MFTLLHILHTMIHAHPIIIIIHIVIQQPIVLTILMHGHLNIFPLVLIILMHGQLPLALPIVLLLIMLLLSPSCCFSYCCFSSCPSSCHSPSQPLSFSHQPLVLLLLKPSSCSSPAPHAAPHPPLILTLIRPSLIQPSAHTHLYKTRGQRPPVPQRRRGRAARCAPGQRGRHACSAHCCSACCSACCLRNDHHQQHHRMQPPTSQHITNQLHYHATADAAINTT